MKSTDFDLYIFPIVMLPWQLYPIRLLDIFSDESQLLVTFDLGYLRCMMICLFVGLAIDNNIVVSL